MSATPNEYELEKSGSSNIAEQLVRPTGVVDPEIEIRPTEGQIQNLMGEIEKVIAKGERILVTTLTKRMSEDLTTFLEEKGIKVNYLHSDVDTLSRQDILDDLNLPVLGVLNNKIAQVKVVQRQPQRLTHTPGPLHIASR